MNSIMKKCFVAIFGLLLSISVFAQSELRVSVELTKVTVFQNRAQLNSTLVSSVASGTTKIILTNIATSIDPNTIRVTGSGAFTILGVKHEVNHLIKTQNVSLQDTLDTKLELLEDLELKLRVTSNEEAVMMANTNIKNEKDGIIPEDLREMVEFFNMKLNEIGGRKLKLARQIKKLNVEMANLRNQIQENQGSADSGNSEVVVTVIAQNATPIRLELDYIAYNAGWNSKYDFRVANLKTPISLAYKANVYQTTGIDWKNVILTLSTANPAVGGTKPELNTQQLSIYEPVLQKSASYNEKNTEFLEEDVSMRKVKVGALAPIAAQSIADYTTTTENALSVAYEIKTPYTISKSGNPETIDVQNFTMPSNYQYASVPKYDSDAFLVANVADWQKYNLLPGTANVYFDGSFVGETVVGNLDTKDTLVLSLGRDKKVVVKKENLQEFKLVKSIGSNVKETNTYKITVRNTKNEAVNIKVEDQIPVSADSRIEVENDELSGGKLELSTGKIVWNINLNPNENREIIVKYSVKYPKGKKINNL